MGHNFLIPKTLSKGEEKKNKNKRGEKKNSQHSRELLANNGRNAPN